MQLCMKRVTLGEAAMLVHMIGDIALVVHETRPGWAARVERQWTKSEPPPAWLDEVREPLEAVLDDPG